VDHINYKRLRKDLLDKVGPSGIMPAIIEIESASKGDLIKLSYQYGLDIKDYFEV
jgi:hypothetical protein